MNELEEVEDLVVCEILRSRKLHPPMVSLEHAWGVIKEELEEYFDTVRKRPVDYNELAQVAACCVMALNDLNIFPTTSHVSSNPELLKMCEEEGGPPYAYKFFVDKAIYSSIKINFRPLTDHEVYAIISSKMSNLSDLNCLSVLVDIIAICNSKLFHG